jgi:hypothetical protein
MTRSKDWIVVLAVLGAVVAPRASRAEEPSGRPYWYGAEAGASAVTQSLTGGSARSNRFSMALRGGVVVNPGLLLGAEVSGFLLEASNLNDPAQGRGISQVFGIAQYHARDDRAGLYGKVGLGYANYWGQHSNDAHRSGWGGSLAVGHDTPTAGYGAFGPVLTFTGGRLGDTHYRAVSIGLSWAAR